MIPGKYNIVCPQGSTFNKQLTYTIDGVPVNLFGYSAKMQVREKYTSSAAQITLDTEGIGGITLGDLAGTITMVISATATAALVPKEYVYDLELTSSSIVTRLIEGKFIVTPEVTR